MPVGGQNFEDIQGAHPIIHYAVSGHGYDDDTHGGVWGVRKVVEIDMPPITRADALMEPYVDAQEIKIKIESWQDTYDAVKRAIILCQVLQSVCVEYGVDFYNFVKNTANPPLVVPTGSVELGMEVTLDISSTEITLTLEYHGKCYPVLWKWVLANFAALVASPTGGTDITGLTAEMFNNDEYGVPGILNIYIGTGDTTTDDEFGLLEAGGSKFQMKIAKMGDTLSLQPISKRVEFKNTLAMFQNRASTLDALADYSNTEQVITWVFANGLTIVLNQCTKIAGGAKFNDQTGMLEVKNEGSTFTDVLNGTATNIVFDDANKKITFNRQGYV